MSLYAIGDLHLSLGGSKPMDVFGGAWDGYVEKLLDGFSGVNEDDTVILCGDISWGISIAETEEDFRFIDKLPGKKFFLKGNHDYWFESATKTRDFLKKHNFSDIPILNNNSFSISSGSRDNPIYVSICGTRGWLHDDASDEAHNNKMIAREALRLRASLSSAEHTEKYCFFHYPPRFNGTVIREITDVMREFGVKRCYFGHIHGPGHRYAPSGIIEGIEYHMVSADYIGFTPKLVI